MDEKKGYMRERDVGMSLDNPYGFQIVGNLASGITKREGDEGGAAMFLTSLGIDEGCYSLLARAKGEGTPSDEGKPFITLIAYGKTGEKLAKNAEKGCKISVNGKLQTFTGKDGTIIVEMVVRSFTPMPKTGGKRNMDYTGAARTYTAKDGSVVTDQYLTNGTFKCLWVGDLSTSASGTQYLRASFGSVSKSAFIYDMIVNGKKGKAEDYPEDATNLWTGVWFGKQAERMAKFLKKNMVVVMAGRLSRDVKDDKEFFTIRPSACSVVAWPDKGDAKPAETPAPTTSNTGGFQSLDDESDELPAEFTSGSVPADGYEDIGGDAGWGFDPDGSDADDDELPF